MWSVERVHEEEEGEEGLTGVVLKNGEGTDDMGLCGECC